MNGLASGRTTRRRALGLSLAATVALALPGRARAEHVVRPWPAGKPTPPLSLSDLDGKPWSLAALAGRPVLLNFWATWCVPCRAEMPSLERLAARHARAGLAIVAVNYKEPVATIRQFLSALPFGLPILLDPEGEAAGTWTPRVFPSTVLVDRHGVAQRTVIGELDWMGPAARDLVEPLLARPPGY